MKRKLKSLKGIFLILIFIVFSYNIFLSSFFLCKIVLPYCGKFAGVKLNAKEISLSFLKASLYVRDFSINNSGEKLLNIGTAEIAWEWLPLYQKNLKILKLHIRDTELSPLLLAAGTHSNQKVEEKNKESGKEGKNPTNFPFNDFLIQDVRIENFLLRYSKTEDLKDSKSDISAELRIEKLEIEELRPEQDSMLEIVGAAKILSGSACEVRGKFLNKLAFRLTKSLTPKKFDINLKIFDIDGYVSSFSLKEKTINAYLSSETNEAKVIKINSFELLETAFDKEDSLTKIIASGNFQPENAIGEIDFDIQRISPELLTVLLKIAGLDLPGKLVLFCKGKLSSSADALSCAGILHANHEYPDKNIFSDLKCDFDISANLLDSVLDIKNLKLDIALNGNECFKLVLEKKLRIDWKQISSTDSAENLEIPVKLNVKSFELPLVNLFLPKNAGFEFRDGTLDADIILNANAAGTRMVSSGKVLVQNCSFAVDSSQFRDYSVSLDFSDLSFENLTKLKLERFQLNVLRKNIEFARFAGDVEISLKDMLGKLNLSDFSIAHPGQNALPAKFTDMIPLKDFLISGNLCANWEKYFSSYSYKTNFSVQNLSFKERIIYADFSNANLEANIDGKGDSSRLYDIEAKINLNRFISDKALADIFVNAKIDSCDFATSKLAIDAFDMDLALDKGGKAHLKTVKPLNMDFSMSPISLVPALEGNLEIKDYPLQTMHDFFNPSEAFKAVDGTAEKIDIAFKFGNGFNLDNAQTSLTVKNGVLSSAGAIYKIPHLEFLADIAFDGWTKLGVTNAKTIVKNKTEEIILNISNNANFDFSAGSGKITTETVELNEKALKEIMPEDFAGSLMNINAFSFAGSRNVFSYGKGDIETSGSLKIRDLNISDSLQRGMFNIDYNIKGKENGFKIEHLIANLLSDKDRIFDMSLTGTVYPSAKKYHLSLDSEYCDAGLLQKLFSQKKQSNEHSQAKTASEKKGNQGRDGKSFYDIYDIDLTASLKKIKYGANMHAALDTHLIIGGGLLKIPVFKGALNEAPFRGKCEADLKNPDKYVYDLVLETGTFELGNVINPMIESKRPFAAKVKELSLWAKSDSASSENFLKDISGNFRAQFENISIPNTIREKSLMINLIMTPIETIATLGKYIPEKFIPKELSSAAETFTGFFRNFDNFDFKNGMITANAERGKIRLEECRLNGDMINFLLLKGNIDANSRTVDVSSETKIGKIIVPLKIRGSFDKLSPDYKALAIDFILQNTANLANPENITDILKITKDKGTSAGEKTIKIIENILGGDKAKNQNKNLPDNNKQDNPSSQNNDTNNELDKIIDIFKRK